MPLELQYVAFIHGHGGEGWHNFDMTRTLGDIDWDNLSNFTDLNQKPGIWSARLGDALPRPLNPVASGPEVFNGTFNKYQVVRFWFVVPSQMTQQAALLGLS